MRFTIKRWSRDWSTYDWREMDYLNSPSSPHNNTDAELAEYTVWLLINKPIEYFQLLLAGTLVEKYDFSKESAIRIMEEEWDHFWNDCKKS